MIFWKESGKTITNIFNVFNVFCSNDKLKKLKTGRDIFINS